MIEFTKAYKTSDGSTHGTLEQAQSHDLQKIWDENIKAQAPMHMADWLLANKEKVVDILTTGAKSRPRARKVNRKKPAAPTSP